jgi:AraC-like DNA-binding protein
VGHVAQIVHAVAGDRTILRVDDIVALYGLNKRTLQRLFAKYVGVSPKWVIQRYRLHEAAARLAGSPDVSHAALASDLGYSDQAHFVRDFKKIVGMSPAAYGRGMRAAPGQSLDNEAIRQMPTADPSFARRRCR